MMRLGYDKHRILIRKSNHFFIYVDAFDIIIAALYNRVPIKRIVNMSPTYASFIIIQITVIFL